MPKRTKSILGFDMIPVAQNHLWFLLLGYVRYAMGRMSTAPSTAADMVRDYSSALSTEQIQQLREEIKVETTRAENKEEFLGMKCDHDTWRKLVGWLLEEQQRRYQNTSVKV
jgi:hypothetical protein